MKDFKKHSKKRELRIAKEIGGKTSPGSGCFWFKKGDVSNSYLFVEDKFTIDQNYRIDLKVINKTRQQANKECKIPVLSFGFELPNKKVSYACIESCYVVDSLGEGPLNLEARGSSYLINFMDLGMAFTSTPCPNLGKLIFKKGLESPRIFYIYYWEEFIENLDKLFPKEVIGV